MAKARIWSRPFGALTAALLVVSIVPFVGDTPAAVAQVSVFTVTEAGDAEGGAGLTLRGAIEAAQASEGPALIDFAIDGISPFVIDICDVLPAITRDLLTIDATTQSGYQAGGPPVVAIQPGAECASTPSIGLFIHGSSNAVRGLTITGFPQTNVRLSSVGESLSSGNTLEHNVLTSSGGPGLVIMDSDGNTLRSNLLSGNTGQGVSLEGDSEGNTLEDNLIGTDATGMEAWGNGFHGVNIGGPGNNVLLGNVISGNGIGVGIDNSPNNRLEENFIGTDSLGTGPIPNQWGGVEVSGGLSVGNTVVRNTIAFTSPGAGVKVFDNADIAPDPTYNPGPPQGTLISENAIFSNGLLGIDLQTVNFGVEVNDIGDADDGPNGLQNYPVITSAVTAGDLAAIKGNLDSNAGAFTLEFFSNEQCDPSGHGEGQVFVGAAEIPGPGPFDLSVSVVGLDPGQYLTATATDSTGNTSEFSACELVGSAPPYLFGGYEMSLNGDAVMIPGPSGGDLLRLVPGLNNQRGSALSNEPVDPLADWSTFFRFRISDPLPCCDQPSADGLAFVFAESPDDLGGIGGGIGIPATALAIEFDTFDNGAPGDPSGNHVGIDYGGAVTFTVADVDATPTDPADDFDNGDVWSVWIEYDGVIRVFAAEGETAQKPAEPLLTGPIPDVTIPENAYPGFSAGTGAGAANHDILFWSFSQGAATLETASLAATPGSVQAGIDSISIRDIPVSKLTEDTSTASAPLSAIPLSAIGIAESPLSAIPLSAIPLSAIPLSAIKLSDIPLSAIGGWEQFLAGTPLEGVPLQTIALDQVPTAVLDQIGFGDAELASTAIGETGLFEILFPEVSGTTLSSPLSAIAASSTPLSAIPLSAIRIQGLPLSAIPLSAIYVDQTSFESAPLSAIPLSAIDIVGSPLSAIPLSAIDVSYDLCGALVSPCDFSTLGALAVALESAYGSLSASPLSAIPLSAIDLTGIPLSAIPLSAISPEVSPLSAIPLSAIPLSASGLESLYNLPLADTYICQTLEAPASCGTATTVGEILSEYSSEPIASSPLSAIPLSAIPLSAIPLSAIPLSAIPLSAIELGNTPLSAIDLRNSPLSAIPLSAIPLSAIDTSSSPLSAIPLSAIPLSAIGAIVDCDQVDCTDGTLTLGTIADAGAIRPDATLGDLAGTPLSAIPLSAIEAACDEPSVNCGSLEDLINALSLAYVYGNLLLGDGADFGTLTLADLLVLLIPIDDLPWQDVDPNGLQPIACDRDPAGQCQSDSVDDIRYTVQWEVTGSGAADASVSVQLPAGFVYLEGLASFSAVTTSPEGFPIGFAVAIDPGTVDGNTVTWEFPGSGAAAYTLSFYAAPGFDLGLGTAIATVSLGEVSLTASADVTVTDRGEGEANEVVEDDIVYYRHLTPSDDVDLFDIPIPAQAGSRVSVQIGQLADNDADLIVFKPAGLPPTAFSESSPLTSVPVADESGTQSETIQDVPTDRGQVAGASTQRDTGNEQTTVVNDGSDTGFYTIQVERYNEGVAGAAIAALPLYSLLVDEDPPPIVPSCAAVDLQDGGTPGNAPPGLSGKDTLILANKQRMEDAYGATAASQVMSSVAGLASRSDVNGVVYPVDSSEAVRSAYAAWDANPCDPNAANAVVKAITGIVKEVITASPGLKYIVLVGADDIIPMWREADLVRLSNERDYAPTFDRGQNGGRIGSLYGSFVTGNILTDAAYADENPIPFLSGHLFVEDRAIGRLVELPEEIINQIDTFEQYSGTLDPATADYAVTGYDFLADGSERVAAALAQNLGGNGSVRIDDYTTTSGFWTAQDVVNLLEADPDIASINAHFDHNRALPSDQDALNTETDLFTVADVAGLSADLAGSLIMTMGCHAGTNVFGIGSTDPRLADWAQQFAKEGVTYVANTGFGYGDTAIVAYSERLMELFAQQLDGSRSAGEAFAIAKNLYYLELGMAAVYDAKVMMEATYYGLPMYSFDATAGGSSTPSDPRVGGPGTDPVTGQGARSVSLSDPVGTGGFESSESNAGGSFYTLDGAVTVHDRPIQPLSVVELPVGPAGELPRGAIIESLTSSDTPGFTVAIARPVIDLTSREQPRVPSESFFPTRLQNVACSRVLGEDVCRLTMIRGQFRSNDGPAPGLQGTQRLFTDADLTVYYADPVEPDVRPPTFQRVEVFDDDTGGFRISASVTDDSAATVTRTMCLYRLPAASIWNPLELVSSSGAWTGGAGLGGASASQVEVFCQAVDHAGNVGVTSFKGLNYTPAPPGTVPVPVDTTPPVVNPKVQGAVYTAGQVVNDPLCIDAGSGIATCSPVVDTATAGTKTVPVTATDRAGNVSTSLTVTYYVVEPPSIDVSPVLVGVDSPVTGVVGYTDIEELEEAVTWDWGDGSSGSASSHAYPTPGVYTVGVTVDYELGDAVIASRSAVFEFVVVYDPTGGFVTGGGWIDSPAGAYTADPTLTGKANFGFVSKYKKGQTTPSGNTEFQFKAGDLNFKSTSYEWLVIAGARAQFKGVGTINGSGSFGFLLTAIDGARPGGGGVDKFRIKIWNRLNDSLVYDNKIGSADDSSDATALGGGSIVIKDK